MKHGVAPGLIVLSGLPGTGKTVVAERLAKFLDAPVFAKDWIQAPMVVAGALPREVSGRLAYDVMTSLARHHLARGHHVIFDSVAVTRSIREEWRALAAELGARWLVIECVCRDEAVHRERMNGRLRGIPNWPELEWAEVEHVRSVFEPWDEERLVLDAGAPLDANLAAAESYVRGCRPKA